MHGPEERLTDLKQAAFGREYGDVTIISGAGSSTHRARLPLLLPFLLREQIANLGRSWEVRVLKSVVELQRKEQKQKPD